MTNINTFTMAQEILKNDESYPFPLLWGYDSYGTHNSFFSNQMEPEDYAFRVEWNEGTPDATKEAISEAILCGLNDPKEYPVDGVDSETQTFSAMQEGASDF